jgi:hypothetical protein
MCLKLSPKKQNVLYDSVPKSAIINKINFYYRRTIKINAKGQLK